MKTISFGTYLDNQGIKSMSMIRAMLRAKTFTITNNSNGHDYNQFVDKTTGTLKLSNPDMRIGGDYRTVDRGIFFPTTGRTAGNTISLYDITESDAQVTKLEVLSAIEAIEKKKRKLDEELVVNNKFLEFMLDTNSDVMIKSKFDEWAKNKITESLKEKNTSIATVKV